MTIEALSYVNGLLESIDLPYEFLEWTRDIPSTFFVGEYTEVESLNEDGLEESTFILTGTTTEKFIVLETWKNAIKELFNYGLTAIMDSGSGIAINYSDSFPIPSVDEGVRRIQINIIIKEWRC